MTIEDEIRKLEEEFSKTSFTGTASKMVAREKLVEKIRKLREAEPKYQKPMVSDRSNKDYEMTE